MKKKKLIIIGAGLAGMSAGSYLQMNGFDTEIYEMGTKAGGLCTSWRRNDYLIDGCIHFMSGISPNEVTYPFWNNLIDMKSIDFVLSDSHAVVEDENKNRISFYSNIDKLEVELLTKAPEDKKYIKEFIGLIRKFIKVQLPVEKPFEVMNLKDKLKAAYQMMPYLYSINKYLKISNYEYAAKFKNPLLKYALETVFVNYMPLFYSIMPLVWRHKKDTGYPKGGAIYISNLLQEKYEKLGGEIHFNTSVDRILTEEDRVKGIKLNTGQEIPCDIVVSASDGRSTIFELLQGKHKDKNIVERYDSGVFEPIDKTLYVAIGVNKDFSGEPRKLYFPLKTPIVVDALTTLDHLEVSHYCDDPASAPEGKTVITLMPDAKDWEYWNSLRKTDREKYENEKTRIANEIIEALDAQFGDIKANLEMIDVSTPATYIRYTNNWTGGQISWKATRETFGKPTTWKIKGLSDFYMTGQWAGTSGGLNNVVMMGNHLAQIICKDEGKAFQTN